MLAEITSVLRSLGNSGAHNTKQRVTVPMTWAMEEFFAHSSNTFTSPPSGFESSRRSPVLLGPRTRAMPLTPRMCDWIPALLNTLHLSFGKDSEVSWAALTGMSFSNDYGAYGPTGKRVLLRPRFHSDASGLRSESARLPRFSSGSERWREDTTRAVFFKDILFDLDEGTRIRAVNRLLSELEIVPGNLAARV